MPIEPLPFTREEINNSIVDRFEKIVLAFPQRLAIKTNKEELTFQELNRRVNKLAFKILDQGDKAVNSIAIFLSHNEGPIIAMMSILKTGKVFVPLNPSSPDERIQKILRSSSAEIVITDYRYIKRLTKLGVNKSAQVINIDNLPKDLPENNPGIKSKAEDLLAIIYTSGSTGIPKGVMHVQKTIMHNTWVQTDSLKINPQDRHTLIPHLSYVAGSTDILRTLLNGASLFPIDFLEVGLKGISNTIEKEKISIFHSVPTIFRRLIEEEAQGHDYSSVRIVHLGGEPVYAGDVRLIRKYFSKDCVLLNNLGSTEVPTYRRYIVSGGIEVEEGNLPVGVPVSDKKVTIVGENGKELEPGEVGEIVIESKYMSWGYFNDSERSERVYRPLPTANQAGRFFSGDIGSIDGQGVMKFLGRKDYQVKIFGNRVELGEVEANMLSINGVHQAVALVKQFGGEKILMGYIVLSKGKTLSIEEIRHEMLKKIPSFMVPKQFLIMESFPYTQTNKIDREKFPEPVSIKTPKINNIDLPRNVLEERLSKIWQESLDLPQIGIRDNFFELGGDSLTAVKLFLSIENSFGVKMPISILLEAGDIEKQAMILNDTERVIDWSPIISVQPLGDKPPLFCLFGKGGNPLTFRQFSDYFGEDQPVFFLQSRGLNGRETPLKRVEEIASDFIREIKKIWPQGPYRFCGASFGGMVGYEIAKQLRKNNEDVDLVVLFDTYGPGYPKFESGIGKIKKSLNNIGYYINKHFSSFRNADGQGRRNYFRYYRDFVPEFFRMKKREIGEGLENWRSQREIPNEIKEVIRANIAASEKYQPGPYEGKVVLLRVSNQPPGVIPDEKLGWGNVEIHNLDIHEIDAHHGSILFEPSVKKVVEILQKYL